MPAKTAKRRCGLLLWNASAPWLHCTAGLSHNRLLHLQSPLAFMPKGITTPLVTITEYRYVYHMSLIQVCHVQVGPHICLFKTHVDIFDHWDASVAEKLRQIADKHSTPFCHPAVAFAPCNAFHGVPFLQSVKSSACDDTVALPAVSRVCHSLTKLQSIVRGRWL